VTPAKAEDLNNCPSECIHSLYGCCPDGKTASRGPGQAGCAPKNQTNMIDKPCNETEYGCCSDGFTIALNSLKENCLETTSTEISTSSLIIDITKSTTTKERNIELKFTKPYYHNYHHFGEPCVNTPFECCPDGVSAAHVKNIYHLI
jgi:hypothetical protein